jgi:hypothetical protein
MKILFVLLFMWSFSSCAQKSNPSKVRYFMIGYMGTSVDGGAYAGGFDTCLTQYPSKEVYKKLIEDRYNLHRVIIVAVTEYSEKDRLRFYQ